MFRITVTVECPVRGCNNTLEVQSFLHPREFIVSEAVKEAEKHGWVACHHAHGWEATCPECIRKRKERKFIPAGVE